MELIISDIHSAKDLKLFTDLANRLGLKATKLSAEEKEDIALVGEIIEGRKSGYVDEAEVMKVLHKIQGK